MLLRTEQRRKVCILKPPVQQFICVGAARSGTTSLWHWLTQHPDVTVSPVKETNFFAHDLIGRSGAGDKDSLPDIQISDLPLRNKQHAAIVRDTEVYLNLIMNNNTLQHGEISPAYLYYANRVAFRIRRFNRECKIIIFLREPVSRAISNYTMLTDMGREKCSIRQALNHESDRIQAGWEHIWAYRGLGSYYEQVSIFLEEFGVSRVWIGLYEDLAGDPQKTFDAICDFLEIRRNKIGPREKTNQSVIQPGILLSCSRKRTGRIVSRFMPRRVRKTLK
ncbi:MAG: sulfotransferase family protein, partial [Ktedonobacteraceae bacterium]